MKESPSARCVDELLETAIQTGAKTVTKYHSPSHTVKLTRRHKPDRRNRRVEFVLTVGVPNYQERDFIKAAKKAGELFPVKKIQIRAYPEK